MNIFKQIKNSVYGKEYYQSVVLNQSLRSSVKYLAKLILLLSLLGAIMLAFSLPKLLQITKDSASSIIADYPDDLVVALKEGNVSINKPEPYIVKIPASMKDVEESKSLEVDNKFENLIVINTTEPFTIDKFKSYETFALITKTELITMQSNNGEIKITPLSKVGNIEITKSWVLEKESMLMKLLPLLVSLVVPLSYIGMFIGLFVGTLIMLFFSGLVVWLVFRLKKIDMDYKKSYQVALHASTIILILSMFSKYLGDFNNFLVNLLIFIIVILVNFMGYQPGVKVEELKAVSENTEVNNQ